MFRSRTIRHLTVRTAAVVSLLLLPVSLSAQRSGAFDDARLGDGELERGGGETYALVEGAATLRPDGTAWIVVRSRDERFELRGEWQQGDREQRLLTIYQAMGGIAAAEGWLMSQNGRLKQIELVGRWGGGRRLRLHFLATADLPPRAPVWGGVDSTRPGDGVLDLARSPRPVRRLRVVLDADGSAELVLSPDDFRLVGRWSRESATQVRFDADGGLSGEPGIGSGTIDLRDGEVERVTLVGRSARSDYRLDFAAAPPPPPPPPVPPRPDREELSELFGHALDGRDYAADRFPTLRECQAVCRRDERCRAFTYNLRTQVCHQKERAGRLEHREEAVSGMKVDRR